MSLEHHHAEVVPGRLADRDDPGAAGLGENWGWLLVQCDWSLRQRELRPGCERCDRDLPPESPDARICSFECTFCAACGEAMEHVCPNCGGELVRRPRRSTP